MPTGVYERKKKSVEDRFWAKVNKDTGTDCWHFTGALLSNGYGHFAVNEKMIKAHRFSFELHNGPIAEGMCCLHSCDNRRCCNPSHLFIGTHTENMRDMIKKNRDNKSKGSSHYKSKLDEDCVLIIKKRIAYGEKNIDLAKEYGVCHQTISLIKNGHTWAHVQIN